MNRCPHGVYLPAADLESGKAWGCQSCYPQGHPDVQAPVLPHSSGTPLNLNQTGNLEFCGCGAIALSTRETCNICGERYAVSIGARRQGTANSKQPGVCPACGSAVHYLGKEKGMWTCADCDTAYPAPRVSL